MLEIIVGIAPLLGLVGTIVGMMAVFADVGQAGLTDAAKLAQGIALILKATLIGLLMAFQMTKQRWKVWVCLALGTFLPLLLLLV